MLQLISLQRSIPTPSLQRGLGGIGVQNRNGKYPTTKSNREPWIRVKTDHDKKIIPGVRNTEGKR